MTPKEAVEMYEEEVTKILDAESEVTRDRRLDIMRKILKRQNEEMAKVVGQCGIGRECLPGCHTAMKTRLEAWI